MIRYVYDLLQYLRVQDDPIKQEVGLSSAEDLIRQKAGVGTEIGKLYPLITTALQILPTTSINRLFDRGECTRPDQDDHVTARYF